MTDDATDPDGLFDPHRLQSRVWPGPEGRAVCLVSPSDTPTGGGEDRWLCAAGDGFVDATEYR